MHRLKSLFLLALVGLSLAGCVFEEQRGGPDRHGDYRHGWSDRGAYDHGYARWR
jgi:hypothetical protein